MDRTEVAIVGGGVMGLSAAWRLARAGRDVLLLERAIFGGPEGSSHGATRIFRFAYDDPAYVRMAQASLPLWRELEGSSAEIVRIMGGLDVGDDSALGSCRAALEAAGATFEMLAPAAVRERFDWLDRDGAVLFSPDAGVIDAEGAIAALVIAARAAGADLREHAAVHGVDVDDDAVVVRTAGGGVRARRVIVASGAWTGPLVSRARISIPLRVTREQVFYYDGPDVLPVIFREDVFRYMVPKYGRAPGVKVAEHGTGPETTPDDRSFEVDADGRARVDAFVVKTFPSLGSRIGEETCLYTNTPDEDFVLDARGPLVVVSPCSGHGFKFAPLIGEIAACLAMGREQPVELSRFSLARFATG